MSDPVRFFRRRAFTLIEMLVVMAVIGVLAALLLPALASARERSRRTACMSNLDEFGKGLASYLSEYKGYFPCQATSYAPDEQQGRTLSAVEDDGRTAFARLDARANYEVGHGRTPNLGLVRDNKTGQYGYAGVRPKNDNGSWVYQDTITWHSIGCLSRPGVTVPGELSAGNFNCAPMGLGYLVDGNYMADAQVYYCPTSNGEMPCGAHNVGGLQGGHGGYILQAGIQPYFNVWSTRAWKALGGFGREAFRYGNYAQVFADISSTCNIYGFGGGDGASGRIGRSVVVESDYAYRNVPFYLASPKDRSQDAGDYTRRSPCIDVVPYTKPEVEFLSSGPQFRAERMLGSRAIVADGFGSKACADKTGDTYPAAGPITGTRSEDDVVDNKPIPLPKVAMGWYGHRNGYNVLYGDGSTKWHADPEREIIWFMSRFDAGDTVNGTDYTRPPAWPDGSCAKAYTTTLWAGGWPARFYDYDGSLMGGDGAPTDMEAAHPAETIWHIFDMARGIDVDSDFFGNSE